MAAFRIWYIFCGVRVWGGMGWVGEGALLTTPNGQHQKYGQHEYRKPQSAKKRGDDLVIVVDGSDSKKEQSGCGGE